MDKPDMKCTDLNTKGRVRTFRQAKHAKAFSFSQSKKPLKGSWDDLTVIRYLLRDSL